MKQMKPQKLHLNALTLLFPFLCASTIYAQDTDPTTITKQADATLGQVTTSAQLTPHTTDPNTVAGTPGATVQGGAIRVIDNKGTKKYLQVQNGLTQVTNTAPAGGIVTTWQLGGQLVDDTDIDFNAKALSFDNVLQVTGAPATSATLKAGTTGATGWALLVRDENSGDIKELLASDLIVSGHTVFTATATQLKFDVATAGVYNGGAPITGLTVVKIPLPDYEKVWVYRNGTKLIAGVDYTIAGSEVTLVPIATGPNSWTVYAGDVIEVQYFK